MITTGVAMICPRCVVRTLAAQESAAAARTWHEHGVCALSFSLWAAACACWRPIYRGSISHRRGRDSAEMNCVAGGGPPPYRARQHCHGSGTGSHLLSSTIEPDQRGNLWLADFLRLHRITSFERCPACCQLTSRSMSHRFIV
jgi:hypothetical protein